MVKVNKAVLHIFDFSSDLFIYSQEELDLDNDRTYEYISKHIDKSMNDASLMTGEYFAESTFKKCILDYKQNEIEFMSFAKNIGEKIYKSIAQSDTDKSIDIIICDFDDEYSNNYIGILECNNMVAFTHYVSQNEDVVKNEIINHHAILPNMGQKLTSFVQVNTSSDVIRFFDKKRYVNGENIFVYPDLVLECNYTISPRDTVKLVNKIVNKVADNHGSNTAIAVSKAKRLIFENAEESEELKPLDIGAEVFYESASMREEFRQEIQKAGVPASVPIERTFAEKTAKSHKIKTDTGIELSVPASYFNNSDYIEFINNPDGTIAIQLKNINKIQNK